MVRPAAKREAVAHLRNVLRMSERRACTLVAADRKMIRYRSRRPPDIELRTRLRDLANQRRRFGYRRLFTSLGYKTPAAYAGTLTAPKGVTLVEALTAAG